MKMAQWMVETLNRGLTQQFPFSQADESVLAHFRIFCKHPSLCGSNKAQSLNVVKRWDISY
jgi:hypothetical protein